MIIDLDNVKNIEVGTVLTFERGVEGSPGYGKLVFVYDLPGNPDYPKFSITDQRVIDYIRNRWIVTAED